MVLPCSMIYPGIYNRLKADRKTSVGYYLIDDEGNDVLLPKRYVPENLQPGDDIEVFIYHDSENRLIATTDTPKAIAGETVLLKAVSVIPAGAFLDLGLMKDLFVPKSQQLMGMRVGGEYLVRLYIDEQTNRLAATEKIDRFLNNDELTVKPLEIVNLVVYRRTDIGYVMIINERHTGVLHFNEIYTAINIGDKFQGYIKNINEDNTIDVVLGKPGYNRVEGESEKIIRLLKENNGYLPYHDKSNPDDIYEFFGMSKKVFKMSVGRLYKEQKIMLGKSGIKLIED